jgi:hypothetical protein
MVMFVRAKELDKLHKAEAIAQLACEREQAYDKWCKFGGLKYADEFNWANVKLRNALKEWTTPPIRRKVTIDLNVVKAIFWTIAFAICGTGILVNVFIIRNWPFLVLDIIGVFCSFINMRSYVDIIIQNTSAHI